MQKSWPIVLNVTADSRHFKMWLDSNHNSMTHTQAKTILTIYALNVKPKTKQKINIKYKI